MATRASISAQADVTLLKEITKLIHRIERILVPINSLVHSTIGERLDRLILQIKKGDYFEDVNKFPVEDLIGYEAKSIEPLFRKVAWEKLELAIWTAVSDGDVEYNLPVSVLVEIATERQVHDDKLEKAASKERVRRLQKRNGLPVVAGKWRKEPYGARTYDFLADYNATSNIGDLEGTELRKQLITPLNGFLGQAYNYDDHDLTEEWMVTFKDKASAGPSDDDVIRTQLESLLEIMMVAVQDRVCTEVGVLQRPPLALGKDVKEVPVWGIDCYTRRMVEMSIEDRVPLEKRSEKLIKKFIDHRLLPTINDQAPDKAHDMNFTINAIIKDPKSSPLDVEYAQAVQLALQEYTNDVFRIHPKGTGVICINPAGIAPHVFVTEYLGELYPSYRWCERLDVVEQAQETFELKPTLPDFYNILLERPRQDPNGYGLLYVDASRRANMGSSCSHSCDSNCTSAVVARNGKLVIALTTNRYVHYGEELTMDYYSITTSEVEWRAAICLCGSTECRGSFLHYATQDDLQQVLNQSCGPLWRYASLLRACSERPLSGEDSAVLVRHGMQSSALGPNPPTWVKKFAVDNLRFVEFERKALPCALLRSKDGSKSLYTYGAADMDARSVMEQRLQSMVCCFSMVQQVIERNQLSGMGSNTPLLPYLPGDAVGRVWEKMLVIPALLREHLLESAKAAVKSSQAAAVAAVKQEVKCTASPSSAASSKENAPQKGTATVAVVAPPSPAQAEKVVHQKRGVVQQITAAIDEIEKLLVDQPKGLTKFREICLSIRAVLRSIEHASTAKARVGQLADLLVFWAFTSNFSTVKHFGAVESGPVEVYARELGTNIPRSKVFKMYRGGDIALRSRDKIADIPETFAALGTSGPLNTVSRLSGLTAAGAKSPSTTNNAKEATPLMFQLANLAKKGESSVHALSADVSAEAAASEASDHTTSDYPTASDTPEPSENSAVTESVEAMPPVPETMSGSEDGSAEVQQAAAVSKDYFLSPNEPVFIGTKKYSALFTFWQLMGWFNAGTDQKNEAPDLFGCVELPGPASCFGSAELPYGAKQRDALITLLRDEKSQTMCWPAILKQSFTPVASSETPLYGSPMLDLALGQVGVISKVITALLEGHTESVTETKKKKGSAQGSKKESDSKKDLAQFDNILPPEMPTAWVQCEQCRKWRRVAWFVNSDALPDLWECQMNSWDPDNATCDAPQDSYDPDAENTLGFGTSENAIDPSSFVAGKKFDLYCNKNKVYYEAVVIKIKTNPKKPADKPKALFRFVGWGSRFDELISIDSDRIQPHNLYTNPMSKNPREQEKWQGRKNLYDDEKKPLAPLVPAFSKAAAQIASKASTKSAAKTAAKGGTSSKGTGRAAALVPGAADADKEDDDVTVDGDGEKKAAGKRKRKAVTKKPAVSRSKPVKAVVHQVSAEQLALGYADDFEDINTNPADNSFEMSEPDMMQVEAGDTSLEQSFEQSFETNCTDSAPHATSEVVSVEQESPLGVSFDDFGALDEISPEKRLKVN